MGARAGEGDDAVAAPPDLVGEASPRRTHVLEAPTCSIHSASAGAAPAPHPVPSTPSPYCFWRSGTGQSNDNS